MKKLLIATLTALALTGCATNSIGPETHYWQNPNYEEATFKKDHADCKYDSLKHGHVAGGQSPTYNPFARYNSTLYTDLDSMIQSAERRKEIMIACMESRGYKLARITK